MREITIGFSSPNHFKIGAEVIKLWTRSKFSHVYIKFTSETLNLQTVYQASHGMVHFKEYNNFLKDNVALEEYKIQLTDLEHQELLKSCIKLLGEPYGYIELLTLAYYDVCNNLGFKIDPANGEGYYCAELIANLCANVLDIKFDKPTYLLTPQDVENKLKDLYGQNATSTASSIQS